MFNYLGSYKLGGWIMLWHRYDTYTQLNSNRNIQSFSRNVLGGGNGCEKYRWARSYLQLLDCRCCEYFFW